MDRERAAEIQKHLLDADRAIDRARRAIAGLPKADRVRLDDPAREALGVLHLQLLGAIYEEHPDLKPPDNDAGTPEINSTLRWDQVRLPAHISEGDVDAIIFSVMRPHWRKVAMVVGQARDRCEQLGIPLSYEELAARLPVLAEAGRIEDAGDLRKWRYSEVRLKG